MVRWLRMVTHGYAIDLGTSRTSIRVRRIDLGTSIRVRRNRLRPMVRLSVWIRFKSPPAHRSGKGVCVRGTRPGVTH